MYNVYLILLFSGTVSLNIFINPFVNYWDSV